MMNLSKYRSYTATYLTLFESLFFYCLCSLSFSMLYAYRLYENVVTGRFNCIQNLLLCFKCPSVWFCFPDAQFYIVIYDIYFSFVVNKENKNVSSKDIYF